MTNIDVAIIGAGAIGLAIGRSSAEKKFNTVVFEQEDSIGQHTSTHGSGVIHSGIYYPKNSLKAILCLQGRNLLYKYADEKSIPCKRIGKIIVATNEEQISRLKKLHQQGIANGVQDLEWLSKEKVQRFEPEIRAVAGLLSPSTGIIDVFSYLNSLKSDINKAGGKVLTGKKVRSVNCKSDHFELIFADGQTISSSYLINCAGLFAQKLTANFVGFPRNKIPPSFFAKGHYFKLTTTCPFNHLIYPLPEPGGLGIHLTQKLDGIARFGPDVVWTDKIDYSFAKAREKEFYKAIRKYYPELPEGSLVADYVGIRPKLASQGSEEQDFLIQKPREHGISALINLFGIESPGLTASLAIAEYVTKALLN